MASRWKHDINQHCIFCVSNISQGNVDIQKSASTHMRPFSQKILSSVLLILFWQKSWCISKTRQTGGRLLYTQLEHDKIILQEQHHLLQVFGLFIIMFSFKQHSVFFLVEQYPLQFSTNESLSTCTSTINSRTVLCQFHAKDRLIYNQAVIEKFEQCWIQSW